MKNRNHIYLITGGNGLLGKEIINYLSKRNGTCINLDISHETDLKKYRIKCDITSQQDLIKALKIIHDNFGQIDGLVNNAYPRTNDWGNKFEDVSYDSWKTNVDWQLNSSFYLIQQIVPFLNRSQRCASIVNIGSIYGIVGPDFSVYEGTKMTMPVAYSAIKGALVNLTRYLSVYLGPMNVRVNLVSPGGIFDHQPDEFVNNYKKKVPLGRMADPRDISPAVGFLLSEESNYITGQNIVIDGGWTAK